MSTNKQRREESFKKLEKELKSRDRVEKTRPLGVVFATLAIMILVVGGIWWASNSGSDKDDQAQDSDTTTTETTETSAQPMPASLKTPYGDTVTCEYKDSGTASKEVAKPNGQNISTKGTVKVTLHTNQGDIEMTMDRDKSPCTVNAIESLAKAGFYNDTVCHRLTNEGLFVLQCGDPSGTGSGGPGFSFADEFPANSVDDADKTKTVNYARGTLAMANAGADTNGSQFFLVYKDSPLQPAYNVFGTISDSGLKVIDDIAAKGVKTDENSGMTAPKEEVKIQTVDVAEA